MVEGKLEYRIDECENLKESLRIAETSTSSKIVEINDNESACVDIQALQLYKYVCSSLVKYLFKV